MDMARGATPSASSSEVGPDTQIAQDDLCGVVTGKACDVPAWMAARSAEIQLRDMCAVIAGAPKWAIKPDLFVGECADQEVALAHIGKLTFHIKRRAREHVHDHIGQVRGMPLPEPHHDFSMLPTRRVPVRRVAV